LSKSWWPGSPNRGGTSIHLITLEDNPRAVAFWRRHGFEEIDKRIQDFGTKKNVVQKMVRRLSFTAGVARPRR
jgi:ribosomal protein S18 acetylase RimI-like enzyme